MTFFAPLRLRERFSRTTYRTYSRRVDWQLTNEFGSGSYCIGVSSLAAVFGAVMARLSLVWCRPMMLSGFARSRAARWPIRARLAQARCDLAGAEPLRHAPAG